jgi:hypothetical protein
LAEPLAPEVIVIHPTLLVAVQPQLLPAVTLTEPAPPLEAYEALADESAYVHETAASMMVNVCPAMVTVPVRVLELVLATTKYSTVPLPSPAPTLLLAVQLQPLSAVTLNELEPPLDVYEALAEDSEYVQVAPASVTVKVCPAMVMVPVRGVELVVLAITE